MTKPTDGAVRALTSVHPIQTHRLHRSQAHISSAVTLAAYEVYSHVHGPQETLITGCCRGGFGIGELVAFLYARSFPKEEWSARVDEAFRNMDGFNG